MGDDIIAALQSKYAPGFGWTERQILLTGSDVEKWSGQTGLFVGVLYDALALKLEHFPLDAGQRP